MAPDAGRGLGISCGKTRNSTNNNNWYPWRSFF
jgi:hypothetical protein